MNEDRERLMYGLTEALGKLSRARWFLGDSDLSLDGFMILDLVSESDKCRMKDIVSTFSLPGSTATGIVDRLVERGYVKRGQSKKDRRMILLEITPKGRKAHDTFRVTSLVRMQESLSHLTEKEIRTLLDLVEKLVARLAES